MCGLILVRGTLATRHSPCRMSQVKEAGLAPAPRLSTNGSQADKRGTGPSRSGRALLMVQGG